MPIRVDHDVIVEVLDFGMFFMLEVLGVRVVLTLSV